MLPVGAPSALTPVRGDASASVTRPPAALDLDEDRPALKALTSRSRHFGFIQSILQYRFPIDRNELSVTYNLSGQPVR